MSNRHWSLKNAAVSHPGGFRLQLSARTARVGCIAGCIARRAWGFPRTDRGVVVEGGPLQVGQRAKSQRVVHPPADGSLRQLQRCLFQGDTAAPWENLFEQAVDATDRANESRDMAEM